MKTHIAIGLLACAALACGARTAPARATGQGGIRATVKAQTAAGTLTGVHLSIAPAGIELDLALDAKVGAFGGFAFVPAGAQTLTAVAFVGTTRVGSGTATVTVADKVNTAVHIAILDETGARPSPDHGPIVTSLAGPTAPGVGETVTLTASALDPDDASAAIAFAWSASCGGAFGTPGAASTTWTPAAAGPCTVSVVATSNGLSDRGDLLVAVGGVTTCSDLVDVSAPVQTQWVSQPMPAPAGGTVADGTYVLVSSIDYGGTGGPPPPGGSFEQVTIRIQGGRIEVADRGGAKSGTIAVVGPTSLEVDLTCPSLQTMRLGYSADATSL
ncbi:MAG TPA: hypothetical protein VI300_27225, partial [Solirubrobacter sp.]